MDSCTKPELCYCKIQFHLHNIATNFTFSNIKKTFQTQHNLSDIWYADINMIQLNIFTEQVSVVVTQIYIQEVLG